MASNDFSDSIEFNAIPFIDLRVLSKSDLQALSVSANNSTRSHLDDIIIPKTIDKSVFNESAGSRKQTYSRFRLAPPPLNPNPKLIHSSYSKHPTQDDRVRVENPEVSEALRDLFNDKMTKPELVDDLVSDQNAVEYLLGRSDKDEQVCNVVVGYEDSDVAGSIKKQWRLMREKQVDLRNVNAGGNRD